MAFRPLTDAECGQINPLAQLASHITQDRSHQNVHGQAIPGPSGQEWVDNFLHETKTVPQSFHMEELMREMQSIERSTGKVPVPRDFELFPHSGEQWTEDFLQHNLASQRSNVDFMREMQEIESQKSAVPPVPALPVKEHLNEPSWGEQYVEDGKMFSTNRDYDSIWAEMTQNKHESGPSDVQRSAGELIDNIDDPKFVYSKFMNFMNQVKDGDVHLDSGKLTENEANVWSEQFLNSGTDWATQEEEEEGAAAWSEEFLNIGDQEGGTIPPGQVKEDTNDFNASFWNNLEDEMKKVTNYEDDLDHPWLSEFSEFAESNKEYEFSEENPMFDINNPLERGKTLLEEGDFPSAVLCFEAAVKKDPQNSEAWQLLGTTQAENEQDPKAISALKQCINLDPMNSTALMSLAISYTNESYYNQACDTMVTWLRANPKYADLVPPDFKLTGDKTRIAQELFIKAAQRQPSDLDYEVQCGLGVLFNLSGEYDKAADCFKAALTVKPDDARLWNRLGATLANGTRPEEAVGAYHQALNLSPGYIRARYNVGITCINLSAYKEAAEHFLTALNQQARGRDVASQSGTVSQMSDQIWSTLRMAVSLMNRPDLRGACDSRDLKLLNGALEFSG